MEERTTVQFMLLTTKNKSEVTLGTNLLIFGRVSLSKNIKFLGVFVIPARSCAHVSRQQLNFCASHNGRGSSNCCRLWSDSVKWT